MSNDHQISKEYADQGYWVRQYPDQTITVVYKDKELVAFPQEAATCEALDRACQRHMARLRESASEIIPGLTKPIRESDFSARTVNALKRNGIWASSELETLTDKQLLRKHGLGKRGLEEIRQVIPNTS